MAESKCGGAEQVIGATLKWRKDFSLDWGGGGPVGAQEEGALQLLLSPSSLGDSTLPSYPSSG